MAYTFASKSIEVEESLGKKDERKTLCTRDAPKERMRNIITGFKIDRSKCLMIKGS